MRYDFAPLERLIGGSVAQALGVHWKQITRWREYGLTDDQAERLALKAGFVPYEVWPEWLDAAFVACVARGCEARFVPSRKGHRYCSTNCQERERVRRQYHADETKREAKKAARRAYYAEATEYERRQSRRRYHADVELSRARKREQRAAQSATRCTQGDRESMVA